MTAYYNEFDPKAAAWLRELIRAGLIADGVVDERSITDVSPADLLGFRQVHFFAGIGGWSYALRLAGWDDDRPVWTGSCPCQPFSTAGKRKGTADSRHLWPEFARLIRDCLPATVFGEQVASRAGRDWLSGVRTDLEALEYAVGAADLCAAGVSAPHIRQRLFWVGHSIQQGLEGHPGNVYDCNEPGRVSSHSRGSAASAGSDGGVGYAGSAGAGRHGGSVSAAEARRDSQRQASGRVSDSAEHAGAGLGDAAGHGLSGRGFAEHGEQQSPQRVLPLGPSARRPWDRAEAIFCGDGKTRRIEPGLAPLAHGVSERVGLLRGYGNAIVPQLAAQFIEAAV